MKLADHEYADIHRMLHTARSYMEEVQTILEQYSNRKRLISQLNRALDNCEGVANTLELERYKE